jgi:hypothetical protein
MDSVDFGGLFAFTAIDIYTREADVLLVPELTAPYGLRFLKQRMTRQGIVRKLDIRVYPSEDLKTMRIRCGLA